MARYAERHYGVDSYMLHPKVIVEHYTATTSFGSAYNTFAADVPDAELHQLPGTCAHFIIDRDGTIYQLVRLDIMCRHTVGLNYVAIGNEHVGTSDAQILGDAAQFAGVQNRDIALFVAAGRECANAHPASVVAEQKASVGSDVEERQPARQSRDNALLAVEADSVDGIPVAGVEGAEPDFLTVGGPAKRGGFDCGGLAGNHAERLGPPERDV